MTFTILHRRSNVAGHIPTTSQLSLGEVAVNTYDGLMYFVQNVAGSNSLIVIGPTPTTANALTNSRTISLSGDASGSVSFNGSSNVTITTTLASITSAGTFGAVVINAKGQVTSGLATSYSGDVTGSTTGANATLTLATVNSNVGSFNNLTVNAKGLVTSARVFNSSDITTALTYTPLNKAGDTMTGSLTIVNGHNIFLTDANGTNAYIVLQADNNYVFYGTNLAGGSRVIYSIYQHSNTSSFNFSVPVQLNQQTTTITVASSDNTTNIATTAFVKSQNYLTTNQNITLSGDITGSGTNSITTTLASITSAGTFGAVVINAKGQVTSGLATSYSGDVSGSTSGANAILTLATVNSNVGTFNNLVVNAKGLITSARVFNSTDITTALGYTPVNKAGDSLLGNLALTGTYNVSFATGSPNLPTFGTSSPGTKLILYPSVSNSTADYALGISSGTIWMSLHAPYASDAFSIYGGTTVAHTFDGAGNYTAVTSVNSPSVNVTGNLQIFGANTIAKEVYIYSTMNSVTSNRWQFGVTNGDYPGGNNTGANFVFSAYSDSGSFISTPITITRATGVTTFSGNVAVGTGYASNLNISFGTSEAAPTFNTSSIGSRLILLPSVSSVSTDYALGVSPGGQGLWMSLPQYNSYFNFLIYGGTQIAHTFDAAGNYTPGSSIFMNNNNQLNFKDTSGNYGYLISQSDNNLVLYTTNGSGGTRAVWGITQNSSTSSFNIGVPATAQTPTTGDNSTNIATTAFMRNSFPGTAAASGYQQFPDGTIIQWGSGTTSANGTLTITFSIAFPNQASVMTGSVKATSGVAQIVTCNPASTTTGYCYVVNSSGTAQSGVTVGWHCIGY